MDTNLLTVYVLRSLKNGYLYIGFTTNLPRRVKEHNAGQNKSTKGFTPYKLIFQQTVRGRKAARALEKKLKTGYYREKLKKIT